MYSTIEEAWGENQPIKLLKIDDSNKLLTTTTTIPTIPEEQPQIINKNIETFKYKKNINIKNKNMIQAFLIGILIIFILQIINNKYLNIKT